MMYNEGPPIAELAQKTLLGIRRKLIELSGHYELAKNPEGGDWSDTGANYHINSAIRSLDNAFTYHKSDAWLYKRLAAGDVVVSLDFARYIREVWIVSEGKRVKLSKVSFEELRTAYPEADITTIDAGTPAYWAPAIAGLAPEQLSETRQSLEALGLEDLDLIELRAHHFRHFPIRNIVVMPPPSVAYTVEVLAAWYSPELTLDTDVCFWTVNYPSLVVRSARRELELDLHRNTQGYQDFDAPIFEELRQIYHNMIAEEVASVSPENMCMEG